MARLVVRRTFAKAVLKAVRWRTEGTLPKQAIVVGAPHTSNWDWVFAMLFAWSQGHHPKIMVKKEFFVGPLAPIMRLLGSVSIDRKNPTADVKALVERINSGEAFLLAIAAEGTRGKSEYWKSGFLRIAAQTGLPVTMAFMDGPSRTVGCGPTFHPTGDNKADMDVIRAFYADKRGMRPHLRSEPRLRNEDG